MTEKKELTKIRSMTPEEYVEKARKAELRLLQERKDAPVAGTSVDEVLEDADVVLMKRYCPEALPAKLNGGKKPTKRCYFDYEGEHDVRLKKLVNLAWTPVVKDSEYVRRGQDIMFTRSIKFFEDAQKKSDEFSRDQLRTAVLAKTVDSPTEGVSGSAELQVETPD